MFPTQVPQGYKLVPEEPKKKFMVRAVIPTTQYGNIQPEYEVEAESYEEAEKIAMPYIEKLWAKYCQKGFELKPKEEEAETAKPSGKVQLVEMVSSMTPGMAWFNEEKHVYLNEDKTKKLLSGSAFCHKYQHPFDKENILAAMAEKHGVPAEEIERMWELKAKVSTDFGSALHGALEMYGKFQELGQKTGSNKKPAINSALHDHPIIQKAVEQFFKGREKENARYEEFIIDSERGLCGQLDRVLITSEKNKICRVQDFKTNADINKKGFNGKLLAPFDFLKDTPLEGYWLQLSFYADILKKAGWTVEGLDIFHHDGERWVTYTREPIDLSGVLN